MKKWIKNLLITAAVLTAVGLILVGIGLVMGGVQGIQSLNMSFSPDELLELPAKDNRYELAPDGIRELEIEWTAGDLTVQYWEGDTLVLQESSQSEITARTRLEYTREGDSLKVEYLQGWNWFGMRMLGGKNLVVLIPQSMEASLEKLEADCVAAQVNLTGIKTREMDVETVSGDIRGTGLGGEKVDLETVSGRLDAAFAACPRELEAESVSGAVVLRLPEDSSFMLSADTVSGELHNEFKAQAQADSRVSLESVSGSLQILKGNAEPEALPQQTEKPDVTTSATED